MSGLLAGTEKTISQVAERNESGLMTLHGMGPKTVHNLRAELQLKELSFKE